MIAQFTQQILAQRFLASLLIISASVGSGRVEKAVDQVIGVRQKRKGRVKDHKEVALRGCPKFCNSTRNGISFGFQSKLLPNQRKI
jgi:hypothetical protein